MKKLLTLIAIAAFATSSAYAAQSRVEALVNKTIAPVTQKEKELNAKIEAKQKADEQRKAELAKKQAADKAALEKRKQEAQARHQATKNAIQAEKDYLKSLKK